MTDTVLADQFRSPSWKKLRLKLQQISRRILLGKLDSSGHFVCRWNKTELHYRQISHIHMLQKASGSSLLRSAEATELLLLLLLLLRSLLRSLLRPLASLLLLLVWLV